MKKYIYSILILSILGAILSGVLVYQHFFPDTSILSITCGKGLYNSCITVGQSPYASVFGVPIAGFGLLFFFLIIFIILIADYAKESYYDQARIILIFIIIGGLAVDSVLAALLIKIGAFCLLCVTTYAINIGLLLILLHWQKQQPENFLPSIPKYFFQDADSSHKRAALACFIALVLILVVALFSTIHALHLKANRDVLPQDRVMREVDNFYKTKPEHIIFPEVGIVLGNPQAKVTIYAFTDFLCSACYSFYTIEKYILAKYSDRVKIVYYHYPLDKECNVGVKDTIYTHSCLASQAVLAADELHSVADFIVEHFNRYASYSHEFSEKDIALTLKKIGMNSRDAQAFRRALHSPEIKQKVKKHIQFADSLNIEATPTIYVAERRMEGFPPKQIFEEIIKQEIKRFYK